MLGKAIQIAVFSLCLLAIMLIRSHAGELPDKVTLSGSMVEEIFRALAARPYSEVAMTIAKLQAEVQHQAVTQPSPAIAHPDLKPVK